MTQDDPLLHEESKADTGEKGMKCNNCGTKHPKKFKFCKECGEELVAAAPQPAAAPQQPAVVIIKEEKRRRGVPALIWILVGMILVVLLCGLLVWLDFVDVPEQIRVRLPDPIGDLVDAVDDARPPGAPDLPGGVVQDEPGQRWEPPQNPPASQGQQPSQPQQPAPSSDDACDEDLESKFVRENTQGEYYTGKGFIEFLFNEPLDSDRYHMAIFPTGIRIEDWDGFEVESSDVGECDVSRDGSMYVLCAGNGPFKWFPADSIFAFYPQGEDCLVGQFPVWSDCSSGEEYYPNWPYNGGCCTLGCYCDDGSGNWGCWQTCAPACAE
jgi:hypothetical protein